MLRYRFFRGPLPTPLIRMHVIPWQRKVSRKRRPAGSVVVCVEPLEIRFLLSVSAPVGISPGPDHGSIPFPFSYNRPSPYQPDTSDGASWPGTQPSSTPADPTTDPGAGGIAAPDPVPQKPLSYTGNGGETNSSAGNSGEFHFAAAFPDGSSASSNSGASTPSALPKAVTSSDPNSISRPASGSDGSFTPTAPLAASTVVTRQDASVIASRGDSANGAAAAFARSLTQSGDDAVIFSIRSADSRNMVPGVDFSRYQFSFVVSAGGSGLGSGQMLSSSEGLQKFRESSTGSTGKEGTGRFDASLRLLKGSSSLLSGTEQRGRVSHWDATAVVSNSTLLPFARWVQFAAPNDRALLAEAASSLTNHLQVDWRGLESRMDNFLRELEEFGESASSHRGLQSNVASIWLTVMAAATLAVEWARRQNQFVMLPGSVVGIRRDGNSARRP